MQTIDQNFTAQTSKKQDFQPIRLQKSKSVSIYGFGWDSCLETLHRIPAQYEALLQAVNPKLLHLSCHMSGIQVHFTTTSSMLRLTASIYAYAGLTQMSAAAQAGVDCYVGSSWEDLRFFDSFRPTLDTMTIDQTVDLHTTNQKLVVLYFPLYAALDNIVFYIDKKSKIQAHPTFEEKKRIAIYGTSITQGGCASRSGLNFTNLLSRKLQAEIINLGFSGNAFGEIEIQKMVASLDKIDLFVLDYEANSGTNGKLEATLSSFIDVIRQKHPQVKIAVVSRIKYLFDEVNPALGKRRSALKEFQKQLVNSQKEQGDPNVYFIDGSGFYGKDYADYTVDSIHPNDLGFEKIANALEIEIKNILLD